MRSKRTGGFATLALKCSTALVMLASAAFVGAQTLQTLCSFNSTNGAQPIALTLGNDGNFYGTTTLGGISNSTYPDGMGTIFRLTTNGTLTSLVSFNFTNGAQPIALTLGPDDNFYGTTSEGGITNSTYRNGMGTIFRLTTNGTLTSLVSFNFPNGAQPIALTLGPDDNFYGMSYHGGSYGRGTVFQVTTNGTLTTLVSFNSTNGDNPIALTLGNDGNFYGTTEYGGTTSSTYPVGGGTIFRLTTNGTLTTLVSFSSPPPAGAFPSAGLTLGTDGNFYGTTSFGGSSGYQWYGTVFKFKTNGTLSTLVSFNFTNGAYPIALTLGTDGNFYGTTYLGCITNSTFPDGMGTIFRLTTNGTLSTLVSFNFTNGAHPFALTLGTDGNFYGTTYLGGITNSTYPDGMGTVFSLLLPPVITGQPQSQTNGVAATVSFLVSATSLSPMRFQWQRNGTNLVAGGNIFGANSNVLTITVISVSDAANYSVVVSNANSSVTSSNAILTVTELPFLASQPQSQFVVAGSNVTFTASAFGAPPLVFQWYFNGFPLGSPTGGTHFSAYTLTEVGTNQSGNYSVKVANGYGSAASSNAALTVVPPPIITTQPTNRTNNAGTTATFSVVVSSVSPKNYQWQGNGTNLVNGGKFSGATGSTLLISAVSSNEAAVYSVTITNLAGSVTSSDATLTVITPPSITAQPLGQRVLLGSSVSFTVSIGGTAPFGYHWRLNGADILNATNAVYSIEAVGTNNAGNYSVVVTNPAGSVTSSNALLTVVVPPALALELWAGFPLLNLSGMLNSNFVVQYNGEIADTNWMELLSITNLPFSPYLFLDPAGVAEPARFYRAFMQ